MLYWLGYLPVEAVFFIFYDYAQLVEFVSNPIRSCKVLILLCLQAHIQQHVDEFGGELSFIISGDAIVAEAEDVEDYGAEDGAKAFEVLGADFLLAVVDGVDVAYPVEQHRDGDGAVEVVVEGGKYAVLQLIHING